MSNKTFLAQTGNGGMYEVNRYVDGKFSRTLVSVKSRRLAEELAEEFVMAYGEGKMDGSLAHVKGILDAEVELLNDDAPLLW